MSNDSQVQASQAKDQTQYESKNTWKKVEEEQKMSRQDTAPKIKIIKEASDSYMDQDSDEDEEEKLIQPMRYSAGDESSSSIVEELAITNQMSQG